MIFASILLWVKAHLNLMFFFLSIPPFLFFFRGFSCQDYNIYFFQLRNASSIVIQKKSEKALVPCIQVTGQLFKSHWCPYTIMPSPRNASIKFQMNETDTQKKRVWNHAQKIKIAMQREKFCLLNSPLQITLLYWLCVYTFNWLSFAYNYKWGVLSHFQPSHPPVTMPRRAAKMEMVVRVFWQCLMGFRNISACVQFQRI